MEKLASKEINTDAVILRLCRKHVLKTYPCHPDKGKLIRYLFLKNQPRNFH